MAEEYDKTGVEGQGKDGIEATDEQEANHLTRWQDPTEGRERALGLRVGLSSVGDERILIGGNHFSYSSR